MQYDMTNTFRTALRKFGAMNVIVYSGQRLTIIVGRLSQIQIKVMNWAIVCFIARNKSWSATNGPHVSMSRVDPYTTLSSNMPNKHFMN